MAKKKSFVLKAKHKSKKGGLTEAGRTAYNRATGSNLKRPQPEGGSRKKSYCARSKGQMKDHNIDCSKTPDKRICLARRRWKCNKSLQKSDMPPKAKLAAFLREHIDNKLALKAAEPTITKSGELEKAISPEQQKENIRKQKELRNKQVVANLKKRPNSEDKKPFDWKNYTVASGPVDLNADFFIDKDEDVMDTDYHHSDEYQDFLEENKFELPHTVAFKHKSQPGEWAANFTFEPHENGKNIRIINTESKIKEEHKNKGLEEAAQKIAEEHYGKPLLTSKKTQPKSAPSKPEPTPAPASSKVSHLRVVKSLNTDKTGMSALMKALKECACKKSDKLVGGKGDTKDISDFDAKEVEMGLKVEMEHTKDREVAQEIVADHLTEDPSYYSKLKGSGLADELEKAISPEQQKENIRKQRELQNKQVVQTLKPQKRLGNAICPVCDSPMDSSEGMAHADCFDEFEDYDEFENFIKQKKQQEANKPTSIPSKTSHLKVVKSLEKAGRCWEGYEPTPGKKPYSKGSCRKIKKLQKNDNEEYDFNTLEELQNHLNENYPLKIDEELASNYAAQSNNHYFDPYSDDVVKYRDYYTVHPSIDNDEFEETYLNHFGILDQMHRQAGEKLKEDWENQEHKEWNEYKDKYENWANNILKTIHNHCGKGNYSVDEAKTTNSKYIWGTKGEDGPEFLIRLGDHPPKDEFDNEFNDKSKKTLSLLFPENTFMRSKNHQEWNKDFNRAQQKRLSFSSKHKIGDHTDVHDFLSNLENPVQKSIKQKLIKALCVQKLQKSISAEAIEAGQYQGEKLDSHHHNRLGNEYKGMAQKAHKMGDRKKAREFHDKALHHFKMADKMGFQEEEPLEKKISGKVAAAGIGLASALAGLTGVSGKTSETADKPPQVQMAAKPIPKEKYPDLGAHDAIFMIESSGGKKIVHKFIPKQNQRAVSRYGLLPTRVMELYARSPEFRESPQGKMVGEILEPHLSKHKTKNFYDTAAFVQKTPKDVRGQLYQQINKITENPEHDKAIFEASRKHSMENLSGLTSDPVELEIMATHAHHWHWPRTKRLYQKGGLDAVVNDEKSKEGNYVKKLYKQLPEGHPVKERIEESLPEVPQPKLPVKKKAPFHGS